MIETALPARGATLHTFFERRALMTELLPTLGYPMKPTEICLLSLCSFPNCLSKLMRAPFPKGFIREA